MTIIIRQTDRGNWVVNPDRDGRPGPDSEWKYYRTLTGAKKLALKLDRYAMVRVIHNGL